MYAGIKTQKRLPPTLWLKTGVNMVEARGIEPRSEDIQRPASTCVVVVFILHDDPPNDRMIAAPV